MRFRLTAAEWVLAVAILPIVFYFGFDIFVGYRGKREGIAAAQADLTAGRLGLKAGGLRRPWRASSVRLGKELYGIEIEYVCGCCPSTYQFAYMSAYNKQMMPHVAEAAPDFTWQKLREKAEKEWSAERKRAN